jgi:hypothetical protein
MLCTYIGSIPFPRCTNLCTTGPGETTGLRFLPVGRSLDLADVCDNGE